MGGKKRDFLSYFLYYTTYYCEKPDISHMRQTEKLNHYNIDMLIW